MVGAFELEALRLARDEPFTRSPRAVSRQTARAVVDVEIASERDPEPIVAVGRASLARASQ